MEEKQNKINRRNFLKTIGAAGLGSVLASTGLKAGPNEPNAPQKEPATLPQVPRRRLGKTGVDVSVLGVGMMFDAVENQIVLRKALQWGVNYWDTADCYNGGNSELGIGKFFKANPDKRKDIFLVTKSCERDTAAIEGLLQRSLKRMETNYIDLYFLHSVKNTAELTEEIRRWAESAKQRKLIRFFGFSVHKDMAEILMGTSKLDWIDAVMPSYNFRLMQDAKLQDAIEACYKAGIGLVAMKTQGHKSIGAIETAEDKKLTEHFIKRGFTEGQAKVKVVLEDKRISCACVGRENLTHLTLNIAAVLDKTSLSAADMGIFKEYAEATCDGYCAGCAHICESALQGTPYVSEVMRYLMYYNSYGERDAARELFAKIPADVRNRLLSVDYRTAEARCPQHLPIAKLMAEAVSKLA